MIAASLAEICAVYPTAGGVYYWSAMLSTKKYAPVVSWVCGWLTLVGNWTVTLSINFSGAQLILSAITLWNEDFVASQWQTVLCFWAVMMIAFLVNVFGAKRMSSTVLYTVAQSVVNYSKDCNSGGRPGKANNEIQVWISSIKSAYTGLPLRSSSS